MKKNKLVVTQSLWRDNFQEKPCFSLNEDAETDVCIVGGGIAGLSIAYQLVLAGKKVIVLERRKVGDGETGNTSAHLSYALDDRFYEIEKMHGKDKAKLAAQSHKEAIDWIEQVIQTEQIDCEFKRIPGLLFTLDSNKTELNKEYGAAHRVGIKVEFLKEKELGKSLVFHNQARFHPKKYLRGLAEAILRLGGNIYEQSAVMKIDHSKNEVILENNKKVKASYIVTATNAQMFSGLSMHFKIEPNRSYVVGLKIPKNSIKDALYWDTADPYHYVRIEEYDEASDILIVGGEDHRVGLSPKGNPFLRLQAWAKSCFPIANAEIVYQWSGQILEPVDYMAYIGRNPKNDKAFMVTGDSGNGLTHGTIAGMLISDLILTGHNQYEALYKVNRLPIRAIKSLLANACSSIIGYIKYLIPQWSKMPSIGEAKVIQAGFKKVAVYRDENNRLIKCSAICNHMGAILSWNPIEKTWDCPAHGSRFDCDGSVINGPASKKLQCPSASSKTIA
ncbi:MAG: oxidoreductase [Gammaproteobacteria bacterium]|jgi:glycine/D-amino acid oxidase-like deaminating enzyme/nitrite reductase/ring-hydroxylating ferredoxin subunit|nr:oxidoreductase [Gammaproteobacteria bacterium]